MWLHTFIPTSLLFAAKEWWNYGPFSWELYPYNSLIFSISSLWLTFAFNCMPTGVAITKTYLQCIHCSEHFLSYVNLIPINSFFPALLAVFRSNRANRKGCLQADWRSEDRIRTSNKNLVTFWYLLTSPYWSGKIWWHFLNITTAPLTVSTIYNYNLHICLHASPITRNDETMVLFLESCIRTILWYIPYPHYDWPETLDGQWALNHTSCIRHVLPTYLHSYHPSDIMSKPKVVYTNIKPLPTHTLHSPSN